MADSHNSEFIIDKEMGYSRLEFLNQFKIFAGEFKYTINKNTIMLFPADITASEPKFQNTAQLIITFSEQPDRTIGSLSIPRIFVKFQFINYTELEYKQFLQKFDLSFQRGGG